MVGKVDKEQTICVFGGTGFIGRHLLKFLSRQNNIKLKTLTRKYDKTNIFARNVQIVLGDLTSYGSITKFLVSDSTVINLAYLNQGTREDNLKVIKNIANACIDVNVKRLIHCSTAVVVGRSRDKLITEDTACKPFTEYEKTKLQVERTLLNEFKGRIPTIIVRPTAVFGEGGRNLTKHIDQFQKESIFKKKIRLSIYGSRKMNLVHVENVASAIWFLACNKTVMNGQCYIISDDEFKENNYADIVKIIAEELGLPIMYPFNIPHKQRILSLLLFLKRRSNTNPQRIYNPNKLLKTGFKKPVIFSEGLRQYIRNYVLSNYS